MGIWSDWRFELGPWVLVSLLLYLFGSQALRLNSAARMIGWLMDRGILGPIWWGGRLAYLAGLPYLALLVGAASPRGMGLIGLDWVRTLGFGVPLAAVAWALILVGWHQASPMQSDPNDARRRGFLTAGWLSAALEAGGQQMHWAFYRDAGIRWLGPYWGAWASLLLLGLEWISGTVGRARGAPVQPLMVNILLAIVTTALYLAVPNWWLSWGLHTLALLGTRMAVGPVGLLDRGQLTMGG